MQAESTKLGDVASQIYSVVFGHYLEEWTVQFEDIKNFHWVTLKNEILWEYVEKSFEYIYQ